MVKQVAIQEKNLSLQAAEAISAGDVMTIDTAGKFALTSAADEVVFVAMTSAAVGEQVAGRHDLVMHISIKGEDNAGNAALAIGDKLYVDVGYLNNDAVANGDVYAVLLEAVATGVTGLYKAVRRV